MAKSNNRNNNKASSNGNKNGAPRKDITLFQSDIAAKDPQQVRLKAELAELGMAVPKGETTVGMKWDSEIKQYVENKEMSKYITPRANIVAVADHQNRVAENYKHQHRVHLNPLTMRYAAEVYPYGGGIAPMRDLRKHELSIAFLGSPAVAKAMTVYQGRHSDEFERHGFTEDPKDEKYKPTNTEDAYPVVEQTSISVGDNSFVADGELQQNYMNQLIKGYTDKNLKKKIPLLPYPVRRESFEIEIGPLNNINKGKGMYEPGALQVGTIQEAIWNNPKYWKNHIGGEIKPNEELTDSQVEDAWDHIEPRLMPMLYGLHKDFPLSTDFDVPQMGPNSPTITHWNNEMDKPDDMSMEDYLNPNNPDSPATRLPATHSMDVEGNVMSARIKEIESWIAMDKHLVEQGLKYQELSDEERSELLELLDHSQRSIANGNWIRPQWRNTGEGKISQYDPHASEAVLLTTSFWAFPNDQIPEWNKPDKLPHNDFARQTFQERMQEQSALRGVWETNYLFPEFEPGLWANVNQVEGAYWDDWTYEDKHFPRDSHNTERATALREIHDGAIMGLDSAANLVATNAEQKNEEERYAQQQPGADTSRHRMRRRMGFGDEVEYKVTDAGEPGFVTRIPGAAAGKTIADFLNDKTLSEYAHLKGKLDTYDEEGGQMVRKGDES